MIHLNIILDFCHLVIVISDLPVLWGWQPYSNYRVTFYCPGIKNCKFFHSKGLVATFYLGEKSISLKNSWPAGLQAYIMVMKCKVDKNWSNESQSTNIILRFLQSCSVLQCEQWIVTFRYITAASFFFSLQQTIITWSLLLLHNLHTIDKSMMQLTTYTQFWWNVN